MKAARFKAEHPDIGQDAGEREIGSTTVSKGTAQLRTERATWPQAAWIAVVLAGIELAMRFIPQPLEHWHYAVHRLYYLPIIVAGLAFGWAGGLITAGLSGISYLSHGQLGDTPDARDELDRYLETLVFVLVGVLAGVLADRERRQRQNAERTATELRRVYRELQNSVEQAKRVARMSALGQLSAGLAHEIRNPLASIEGAADIVRNSGNDAGSREEFLEIIQKETRRLNKLVSHFLDFARPRRPDLHLTDVLATVDSVVSLLSQTAARNHIVFKKEYDRKVKPIPCDEEQLRQVLLNLLLNAVQAMPSGGKVTVSVRDSDGSVVIRIQDQGSGIPAENVDSIFVPFFTTKENGTGLGLPVSYQIVQQHGGELTLETNSPRGVCFSISLPYESQVSA
jgi:two-component system sensor histidine kinase HydH